MAAGQSAAGRTTSSTAYIVLMTLQPRTLASNMASRPLPHGRDGWFSLMRASYTKPFKTRYARADRTTQSQRHDCRQRGFRDPAPASVGYYRLSGYWYPDRERVPVPTTDPKMLPEFMALSQFRPGTTFEAAHRRYEFDRRLKLLVLDGLERVEVAMRFQLGHVLGEGHPYAHYDQDALSSSFTGVTDHGDPLDSVGWLSSEHSKWVLKVRRQEEDSKEEFVKHFRRKYRAACQSGLSPRSWILGACRHYLPA